MSGPSRVVVRQPAVAGLFYPADENQCSVLARRLVLVNETAGEVGWMGGIVPHAGWVCSGAIAGEVIGTIARRTTPDVVVVFAAIHTPLPVASAVLATFDRWSIPGALAQVSVELASEICDSRLFCVDDRFHVREHAVEVELPLVQAAWPSATVLPVEVPLITDAVDIGIRTAERVARAGLKAVYLASSDLTHYGPAYNFAPVGVGPEALAWAKDNDRRLLELVLELAPQRVLSEVASRMNACGGGAIAAMLAACLHSGATQARVLRHASSYETLQGVTPQTPDNAVGYAAVVVG